jgi:hypothetical protein
LQQTPSTQFPVEHSLPAAQVVPFAFLQVPAVPVRLHDEPAAVHVVAQQTPCAQMPVLHALGVADEQVVPLESFGTHWPALQYSVVLEQSVSAPHVVRQAAAPQLYFPHDAVG